MEIKQVEFMAKDQLATFNDKAVREERCAVLLGRREGHTVIVEHALYVPNAAPNPRTQFTMQAGDVRRAIRNAGLQVESIVGALHTHPPGSRVDPSWLDVENLPRRFLGVIYHVTTKTLSYYTHEAGWLDKESL